jgi:hypothetical protein
MMRLRRETGQTEGRGLRNNLATRTIESEPEGMQSRKASRR